MSQQVDLSQEPDLVIDYDRHVKDGNVWKVMVQLPMQDETLDAPIDLNVEVHVIAPDQHLARYIASTLFVDAVSVDVPNP
jgi:hypothetical protein|tara:strand:+ start:2198 stop:2437 length:240 start_codon:yes stop_codon:yes gene_type:complete